MYNDDIISLLEKLNEMGKLTGEILKKYEDKILKLKDPELSYYFARDIKGADVLAHYKMVKGSNLEQSFKNLNILEEQEYVFSDLNELLNPKIKKYK